MADNSSTSAGPKGGLLSRLKTAEQGPTAAAPVAARTPAEATAPQPPRATKPIDLTGSSTSPEIETDICVIGAGSGGLVVAAAAANLGVKVVLIEKHKMGGDCLNFGCVPSKALIASGKRAHAMRTSQPFGVMPVAPQIDHLGVHNHVKEVIAAIAPNDSVERFTGLGVHVIQAPGRFLDKSTVIAGDQRIKARRFVVATGSSAAVPPIPGLDSVPYFTNETLFDNTQKLDRLIIIGGGPIGMEMAQAHSRLGSKVVVLEGAKALGKDDPELSGFVLKALRDEGIVIREGCRVERVEGGLGQVSITISEDGKHSVINGTHILIAAGRRPNVNDLGLDQAGIKYDKAGIKVDGGLITSNPKVFAVGDVVGGLQFTHMASYHASIVMRRAIFRDFRATVRTDHVPWVTYTDPELAHIGLTEDMARSKLGKVNVYRWPYHENDRAQAERHTEGLIKVVTDKKNKIVGCTIVGHNAGEIINMWSLAIAQGLNIQAMAQWISPYPTMSEISKRAAGTFYSAKASSPFVRKLVGWLSKLG
jgi:pyruvate/2-oxoglutarate dehydrogenase complex dihydrolipoamide dehydrogenase (E3) component